jgi:hypothetical protein
MPSTLYEETASGVAAAVDVRLPTGRERDLLGAGSTSLKLSGLGSIESGRFSTHGNAGISIGGLARELSYDGAVGISATPRVTVIGELPGRWVTAPVYLVPVSAPDPSLAGVETIRLMPGASSLNMVTLVPGVKCNLSDTWCSRATSASP